jgi:protein-histidine pros-kinase
VKFGLRTKCNLGLLGIFIAAMGLSGWYADRRLHQDAYDAARQQGGLMMETALAVRGYTIQHVKPLLDPIQGQTFLPQTVPAFAATETLAKVTEHYPAYAYRESVLNPTNPRDLARDWEKKIIAGYRNKQLIGEQAGQVETPQGRLLYVARPIQITNPACLSCHDKAEAAPASLVEKYGAAGGFGWQINEVVGAQIVTVPMEVLLGQADAALRTLQIALLGFLLTVFAVVNAMLTFFVIRPVRAVSHITERVSTGQMIEAAEFPETGTDEVADLRRAFNRMRRSLEIARNLLHRPGDGTQ